MATKRETFIKAGKQVGARANLRGAVMWIASKMAQTENLAKRGGIGSRLGYLLMLTLSMTPYRGGDAVADDARKITLVQHLPTSGNSDMVADNDVGFFDRMMIDPNAPDNQWQAAIDAIQPYVIAHTFLHEEFIDHVYSDNGANGTKTLGAGLTVRSKENRRFVEEVLGRRVTNGMRISVQDAKRLTDEWFRRNVYPKMRRAFNVPIPARVFVALAIAAYNAGASQYTVEKNRGHAVVQAVNSGADMQQVMDVFVRQFGKQRGTRWGGIPNKYAVLAMFATNHISNETVLNSIAGAPYMLEKDIAAYQLDNDLTGAGFYPGRMLTYADGKAKSGATGYFVPDSIEQMMLSADEHVSKGTLQSAVRDYMTQEEARVIANGGVFRRDGNAKYVEQLSPDSLVNEHAAHKKKIADFQRAAKMVKNNKARENVHIQHAKHKSNGAENG